MRCSRIVSTFVVMSCFLYVGTALGGTCISYLGRDPNVWYLKSQEPLGWAHLTWQDGDIAWFDEFAEEKGAAAQIVGGRPDPYCDFLVQKCTCWELELALFDDPNMMDWKIVKILLDLDYGVKIGEVTQCRVRAWFKPLECYELDVVFYAAYVKDYYLVRQGPLAAAISVLTPVDGMAKLHKNVEFVGAFGECAGGASPPEIPASAQGSCASAGNLPGFGDDCSPTNIVRKWFARGEPVPAGADERATWGDIKGLYR